MGALWRYMPGAEGLLLPTKEEKALDLSEMAAATESKDFCVFLLTFLSSPLYQQSFRLMLGYYVFLHSLCVSCEFRM